MIMGFIFINLLKINNYSDTEAKGEAMLNSDYQKNLRHFLNSISAFVKDEIYPHTLEFMFESINDWSQFHSIEEVKEWFLNKKKMSELLIEDIAMNEMSGWIIDKDTGNISHISGEFFQIHGVRVSTSTREVSSTWDQPILEQVGYDGGLLGLIRKRINGVPHYLCQVKEEPGNYGKVQISPTLQATFSNLNQAHGGKRPLFSDLFVNRYSQEGINVLFDAWLAEDGGRLYLKRNRGILMEVDETIDVNIPNDNFIWLSLYQIKQLLKEDAWVNPHVRGIIAHG